MGDQQEENNMLNEWWRFIRDKRANKCSLEQFVVIGWSDGATAISRIFKNGNGFGAYEFTPAYVGIVDLVRTDYTIGSANTDTHATMTLENKPADTWVDNFRQVNGAGPEGVFSGWKGHTITNANNNWTAPEGLFGLNHFTLWKDAGVRAAIVRNAAISYVNGIVRDVNGGRPMPWRRGNNESW
jgi:hypothetical protein